MEESVHTLQSLNEVCQWQRCLQLTVVKKPLALYMLRVGEPPGGKGKAWVIKCHAQIQANELEHFWNTFLSRGELACWEVGVFQQLSAAQLSAAQLQL